MATWRSVRAELSKVTSSPALVAVLIAMPVLAGLTAAAVVSFADDDMVTTPMAVTVQIVVFLQAGAVLFGHLVVAQDYQGQVVTSALATPSRPRLAATQGLVTVLLAALLGTLALAASWLTTAAHEDDWAMSTSDGRHLLGAVATLTALAALSWGLTLALRGSVASLVIVLALVFLLSPLIAIATQHVRWLPDRLGARLYQTVDPKIAGATAAWALLAWAAAPVAAGIALFARRDV